MGLENIEHIVVVMMENRSFDNLLGWLYEGQANQPPLNIPAQAPTTFAGLAADQYSNLLAGQQVFASRPPFAWPPANNSNVVPTPDPHEEFDFITTQLFGTAAPAAGAVADMSGFLANYATTGAGDAGAPQIMQSFGPNEANVINDLARNFALCDQWFASVPSQTWPNRAFVHSGSSDGHINNDDYVPHDIATIFNVLASQGQSWGIFHDTTLLPSLTLVQFLPRLITSLGSFSKYAEFKRLCQAADNASPDDKLPTYSFVEPRFNPELGLFKIDFPADYHPPHNVCRGEQFLADVYREVRSSPYRDKILLIITFDEHGGCYDHLPPPTGAVAPAPFPQSRDGRFDFSRFGVRVPCIVVSSYVQPGTVFRASPGEPPYDHTSILATLRDWLSLDKYPQHPFLPSPRIRGAPTLQRVLTLSAAGRRIDWPEITARCQVGRDDESLLTPLNDVQKSVIAGALRMQRLAAAPPAAALAAAIPAPGIVDPDAQAAKALTTYDEALRILPTGAPLSPLESLSSQGLVAMLAPAAPKTAADLSMASRMARAADTAYYVGSPQGLAACPYYQDVGYVNPPLTFTAETINAALVGTTATEVVLAFRGTLPIDTDDWNEFVESLLDWANDGDAKLVAAPYSAGLVHQGFKHSLDLLWDEVSAAVSAQHTASKLPVVITGHSKGGALASLAAIRLQHEIEISPSAVYTFGSPRAGDTLFAKDYDAKIVSDWRFENADDLVPHLPATVVLLDFLAKADDRLAMLSAYNYHHVGLLEFIHWNGQIREGSSIMLDAQRLTHFAELAAMRQFKKVAQDHSLEQQYIPRLAAL